MSAAFDTDVAIIGYGPSGVSAANFLGARGVKAIAFERARDIYPRARAVTVNDWTMRCYQAVGLADQLKSVMDETAALRWITYGGIELTRTAMIPGELGHAPSYAIYQPAMEEKLRDGAARFPDIQVRYGVEAGDIEQDAEGATLAVRDLASGDAGPVRARYVLACDGGSSRTRERLGIAMLGDTVDIQWVIIDAKVKRWWPDRHLVTFWSDRHRPVNDIPLALGNHRWEFPLEPHESEADFTTHDQLWRLLDTMGITPEHVDIHQHAFYRHHVRHAERWRDGRVFLLGDAAHLMPPWAGQGMQSGIRDADNLCWKLAEVLAGRLSETMLDSYQPERAPNVAFLTQVSIGLGRIITQQLSDEEMAAQAARRDQPSPLMLPPMLRAGWLTGGGGAVGQFIPQPWVTDARGRLALLDSVIGNGFALLGDGVHPATLLSADERAGWDRLGARYHPVLTPDMAGGSADDIVDLHGTLTAWMRRYGARVIAVRPDRFVAASDATGLAVPGAMRPAGEPAEAFPDEGHRPT